MSGTALPATALVTEIAPNDGTTYNVAVSGMIGNGTVITTIAAAVVIDAAGNNNTASTSTDNSVTYNTSTLTVTIDQVVGLADPTNSSPINFTVVFSAVTANFVTGDVTLSGTAGATTAIVTGGPTTYNVAVSGMTSDGTVIATIAAGVATDAASNPNTASTSTDNTVTYDTTAPTVTINQAVGQVDPTNASPINFTVTFSENVSGLVAANVTLSSGTAIVSGGPTIYTVAVSGMTQGVLTASLPAGVLADEAGNTNAASTSTDNQITYDLIAVTVTIDQAIGQVDPTNTSPINFTVVFSEAVSGFIDTDVTLSGTALPTTALVTEIAPNDGTTYNVAVSGMTNGGTVIASLNAGVVTDAAGNASIASTSTDNIVNFDPDYPVVLFNADTTPANAAILTTGLIQITVAYSKDVKNDGSAGAANNIVNYLLIEAGANLVFDTISCVVGLAPDDTQITIDSAVYTNNGGSGPFVATLNINGGAPLPVGNYQLLICGTTSIEDLVNNELNNGLFDTTLNFIVTALNTLPNTGFPMDEVTAIPHQPEDLKYASYPDLWLEIPKLNLTLAIVGVPLKNGGWDVTWLNKDAGWLNNSAFPTWKGNSVITAHVWDALNKPGPFARLKELKYGDQIKVHAFKQVYIYEIRESKLISSSNKTDAFKHEEKSWVTLITCENYKELSKTYPYRRMVRAVLSSVIPEK